MMSRLFSIAILLLSSAAVSAQTFTTELFVPSVAKIAGANGTSFQSDLRLVNLGSTEASVELTFLESGKDNRTARSILLAVASRHSVEIIDFLPTRFSISSGIGALRIRSTSPLNVTSRTSTPSPNCTGTFGQFTPALEPAAAAARSLIGGVTHSSDPASGFRTNVGLLNPSAENVTVSLNLRAGDGSSLKTASISLLPLQHFQSSAAAVFNTASLSVANGFIEIAASRPIFAYGSIIDNTSGDPIFVPAGADPGTPATGFTASLTARQWQFTPSTLEVAVGEKVTLQILSLDVRHGFDIFNVGPVDCSTKIVPGAPCVLDPGIPSVISFTPPGKGMYLFRCTIDCQNAPGGTPGHDTMVGTLIVK